MRRATLGLAALACALKLSIALLTLGTNDVLTWETFLSTLHSRGGIALYQDQSNIWFFNHPPFMLHALEVIDRLSVWTGLPFPFWLRVPAILADVGSLLLVAALVAARPVAGSKARIDVALMLLAIAPISIMVSGFHGNTDAVMIFFVVLSIYLLEVKRTVWLAAFALGMALNVKAVPLILLPTFELYLFTTGIGWAKLARVAGFFAIVAVVVFVGSMPYLLQDPEMIALHVLGYGSIYGQWGLPRVFETLFPNTALPAFYQLWGRVVVLAVILPAAQLIQRGPTRPPLFLQCGVILYAFMALTPGFGVQYLVWLVPWVVALGAWPSALYFTTSGIFGFLLYTRWAGGFPWYFADGRVPGWSGPIVWFELLCWGAVLTVLWLMFRVIIGRQPVVRPTPVDSGRVELVPR